MSALFRSAHADPRPGPRWHRVRHRPRCRRALLLANQVEKTYPNGTVAQERVEAGDQAPASSSQACWWAGAWRRSTTRFRASTSRSLPLDRRRRSRRSRTRADVGRARPDQLVIGALLQSVRDPAN
ncbi:hypothetical protein ACU4GD_40550 [Cupriavidus basilensis]